MVTTSGDVTEFTVMGLLPFTNYDCSVTASTSVGEGPPSITLTQRTVESGAYVLHGWLMCTYNNHICSLYTFYYTIVNNNCALGTTRGKKATFCTCTYMYVLFTI